MHNGSKKVVQARNEVFNKVNTHLAMWNIQSMHVIVKMFEGTKNYDDDLKGFSTYKVLEVCIVIEGTSSLWIIMETVLGNLQNLLDKTIHNSNIKD